MSLEVAGHAIAGARQVLTRAEQAFASATAAYGPGAKVGFPNTGYFLPVIYGVTGLKVARLPDIAEVLSYARRLVPPVDPSCELQQALDAGMAAMLAGEVIEAIRYLRQPQYYGAPAARTGVTWLGAADDTVLRRRGIQFVDGTAPGFAVCVGAAPDAATAVALAGELRENHLYVFMAGTSRGTSLAEQLAAQGVATGGETRLVPCGRDVTAIVF
ncbi:MAG TPA: CO dehydrogenase/CO-methylating acetyl-CoA synthase complex subunit beta, partial [Peptococcaceae bacterium]|nr:CO dehydrogenase/CO-methylating acetyl-CoA synthase complex subunit beta [Peptococcaceae bacterium]